MEGTTTSGSVDPSDASSTGPIAPEPDLPPLEPGPGRGIAIDRVETYQALWTRPDQPPGFAVSLIPGRPVLLRFFVDIDEALWDEVSPSGRTMIGRLLLESAQGETLELDAEPFVFRDSTDYNLESTIQFEIPGEWAVAGLRYRLEVDEFHPEVGVLPVPAQTPSYPAEAGALASLDIGPASASPPRLRVHLIPYDYQAGCSASVQLDDEKLAILEEDMQTLYPVVDVELTVGQPVLWTSQLSSLDPVLTDAANRRAAESPAPDVYYAAMIDVCSDCPNCNGGFGYYAQPTVEDAFFRVSVNRTYSATLEGEAYAQDMVRILSHEVGHNHNLQHNPCVSPNGDPGATNPNYPHEGGAIGTFGYRFSTDELISDTTSFDLMTYCNPIWVSDWTWNRLADHITALAGAVGTQGATAPRDSVAVFVDAKGQATHTRWLPMHEATAREAEQGEGSRLKVSLGGAQAQALPSRRIDVDHGDAYVLQLPLPHGTPVGAGWVDVPTDDGTVRLPVPAPHVNPSE